MREEDDHHIIIRMIHLPNTVKGPSLDNISIKSAASKAATNVEKLAGSSSAISMIFFVGGVGEPPVSGVGK